MADPEEAHDLSAAYQFRRTLDNFVAELPSVRAALSEKKVRQSPSYHFISFSKQS